MAICCALTLVPSLAASSARAALPDGRAWELVSPPDKLGNDVTSDSSRTRAAATEAPGLPMAVAFASLGGFADVRGMGISTEYLAQRTGQPGTNGWSTHAITPPQAPLSILAAAQVLDPLYEGDMSSDLTRGIFRAWSPLTADPNVRDVANLYLREDLRQPGYGAWQLLSPAATQLAPISDGLQRPFLAGASADLNHAIFESRLALTPGASPGNPMLYKVDDGVVRLLAPAVTCPDGAVPGAPCSIAGAGASALRFTARAISDDGSRVELSSPISGLSNSISTDPAAPTALYQFDDHGTPSAADDTLTQINASEKAPPDPPQAARFETASRDGERVFFTSGAQLTSTPGSGLYLWRRTPGPGAGHLTLIGGGLAGTAVVGASGDGRSVYFVAPGQLVPGGPAVREAGLYLWREDGSPSGALSFAGGISYADANANDNTSFTWNGTPGVARVTPDGSELLFEVSDGSGLAPRADHGSCTTRNPNNTSDGRCSELYLYRAADSTPLAPDVVCVSCLPAGAPATASAYVNVHAGAGASQVTWHLSRALSDDGRRVFFSTAQALVPEDVNGRVDAYEYDVGSGTVHLLSSGRDEADSWFLDASTSGDDVFFTTREQLVGWDVDSAYDLYDARVGGGFPEPAPPPAGCVGDACHGVPVAPPPVVPLASPGYMGVGNWPAPVARRAAPPKRCRRGTVRRRVHGKPRCVKVKAKAKPRRSRRVGRRARRRR